MRKNRLDPVRDIRIRELIGMEVRVVHHTDPTFVGLYGTVIDETMNTFLIGTCEKTRRMPKKGAELEFKVRENTSEVWVKLQGGALAHRAEDRTKKLERSGHAKKKVPSKGIRKSSR
ncbi:MAG: ribonuclease P protein subunit [Thermoplasmatota archaeon]